MYVDTDPDVLREAAIQMDNAIDMQENQHVRTGTTLLVIFLRHRKRLLPLTPKTNRVPQYDKCALRSQSPVYALSPTRPVIHP